MVLDSWYFWEWIQAAEQQVELTEIQICSMTDPWIALNATYVNNVEMT